MTPQIKVEEGGDIFLNPCTTCQVTEYYKFVVSQLSTMSCKCTKLNKIFIFNKSVHKMLLLYDLTQSLVLEIKEDPHIQDDGQIYQHYFI